jgi:uncharacterized coiled-coil DUF342 family protein
MASFFCKIVLICITVVRKYWQHNGSTNLDISVMSKNVVSSLFILVFASSVAGAYIAKETSSVKTVVQKPTDQIGQDLKDNQKILDRKLNIDAIVKRRDEIDRELAEIRAENKAILAKADKDREALTEARKINENLTKISRSIDDVRQEDFTRRVNAYNQSGIDLLQKIDRNNKELEHALSVPTTAEFQRKIANLENSQKLK